MLLRHVWVLCILCFVFCFRSLWCLVFILFFANGFRICFQLSPRGMVSLRFGEMNVWHVCSAYVRVLVIACVRTCAFSRVRLCYRCVSLVRCIFGFVFVVMFVSCRSGIE